MNKKNTILIVIGLITCGIIGIFYFNKKQETIDISKIESNEANKFNIPSITTNVTEDSIEIYKIHNDIKEIEEIKLMINNKEESIKGIFVLE